MKNARGRGRGGFGFNNNTPRRNIQRPANMGMNNGGPLMTEHLQHINLELDLLKRKREMIEQQQELLETQMMHREKTLHYESPRYFERQTFQSTSNMDNDYVRYYDEPVGSADFVPLNSRKRSYQPEWEVSPASNKRFSGPVRGNDRKYGSRPNPQPPAQPGQGYKRPPREARPARPRYDDRPRSGRVTKPKHAAPNKFGNKPAERASAHKPSPSSSKSEESLTLRPNVPLSNQLLGRLELVMGHLLKELRAKFGDTDAYRDVLQTPLMQRTVKQVLRDRIKELMMNKYIGGVDYVMPSYRERYPPSTDEALLQEVKKAKLFLHNSSDTKLVHSDDPKQFFKINMQNLVHTKLTEMFRKLEEIYGNRTLQKHEGHQSSDEKKNTTSVNEKKETTENEKMDEVQPEHEHKEEEHVENEKVEDTTADDTTENAVANETKEEATDNNAAEDSTANEKKDDDEMVSVKDIEAVLPRLLQRYVTRIVKLLNVNTAFEASRSFILQYSYQKLGALSHTSKQKVDKPSRPETNSKPVQAKTSPAKTTTTAVDTKTSDETQAQYVVKVMGKPGLPKRQAMQSFLDSFSPKFVKRHKRIRNLLFVNFQTEEQAGKILAQDGHTIGNIRLSIKANDKNNTSKQEIDNDDDVLIKEETSELDISKVDSEGLGSELDDQINDLLTSIREAENGGNDTKSADNSGVTESNGTDPNIDESNNAMETENNETKQENDKTTEENLEEKITVEDTKDNITEEDTKENITENKTEENVTKENNTANAADTNTEKTADNSENHTTEDSKLNDETPKVETEQSEIEEEKKNAVPNLKSDAPGTPTRSSARIASTPSAIRTRRTSRLANEK